MSGPSKTGQGPRVHVPAQDRAYLVDRFRQAAFDLAQAASVLESTSDAMSKATKVPPTAIADLDQARVQIRQAIRTLQRMRVPRAKGQT